MWPTARLLALPGPELLQVQIGLVCIAEATGRDRVAALQDTTLAARDEVINRHLMRRWRDPTVPAAPPGLGPYVPARGTAEPDGELAVGTIA